VLTAGTFLQLHPTAMLVGQRLPYNDSYEEKCG